MKQSFTHSQEVIHRELLYWISQKNSIVEKYGLPFYEETYRGFNDLIDNLDVLVRVPVTVNA